ncbi:MAG: hypothetical protein ACXVCE_12575, partial [Bacteriovorax sp.]
MSYMFTSSLFNGDISNWKPYSLDNDVNMFESSNVNIPYWSQYKIIDERNQAIDAYHLNKRLN